MEQTEQCQSEHKTILASSYQVLVELLGSILGLEGELNGVVLRLE